MDTLALLLCAKHICLLRGLALTPLHYPHSDFCPHSSGNSSVVRPIAGRSTNHSYHPRITSFRSSIIMIPSCIGPLPPHANSMLVILEQTNNVWWRMRGPMKRWNFKFASLTSGVRTEYYLLSGLHCLRFAASIVLCTSPLVHHTKKPLNPAPQTALKLLMTMVLITPTKIRVRIMRNCMLRYLPP